MYVGTAHFSIEGASLRSSVFYVLYQFLGKNSWQKTVNQEIKIFITSCAIHTCQSAIKSCLCLMLIKCLFSRGLRFQQQLVGTCCMAASWPHSHLLKSTIICSWCEFLCCVGKKFCQVWRELICLIYDKNAFLKLIFSAKVFCWAVIYLIHDFPQFHW